MSLIWFTSSVYLNLKGKVVQRTQIDSLNALYITYTSSCGVS
jgi:hypothetical protein